jgi:hypothetical protein
MAEKSLTVRNAGPFLSVGLVSVVGMSTTHPALVHPATDAVVAVSVALDELFGAALWSLNAAQLAVLVVGLEKQARRVAAAQVVLLGQAEMSLVAEHQGATSTAAWLKTAADVAPGITKARLGLHRSLGARELTGAAFRAGDIGFDAATAVCVAVEGLPGAVPAALTRRIEQILIEVAQEDGTKAVVQHAARIVNQFAPEELEAAEQRDHEQNRLAVIPRHDGTVVIRGQLDKEAGALALAVLGPLAKPAAAVGGLPDQRTAATRYADAFIQAMRLAGAASPEVRGDRPTVVATISLDALQAMVGALPGVLDTGAVISAGAVRRMACDALLVPVVLGANSEPLDVGRAAYVVPQAMRRALVVRDQGCTMPGCDRPASWCDAHHGLHWSQGGVTALGNVCLLCERHHTIVHKDGWLISIIDGRPWFTPPRWIDPDQTPRLHHRFKTYPLDP